MKYFTSIGSRSTPQDILDKQFYLCAEFCIKGYLLRSGGADGSDMWSEKGCDYVEGQKEIYLPWKNFNNSNSLLYQVSKEALDLASKIHPAWDKCSFGAKKLHGRNTFQLMGLDLKTPSEFVISWTQNGAMIGGTRTAMILAQMNNVPVYNLAIDGNYDRLIEILKNL